MKKILLLIALVALVAGCSSHATENQLITVAEATAVLDQGVAYVQAHDLAGLGALADDLLMTETRLNNLGGWDAAPNEPPTIVGNYLLSDVHYGGYVATGGRVLVLEGIDGLGKPYHSEVLVFHTDGKLALLNATYWDNSTIGAGLP
jgi:hypothetical protein